MQCRRHLLSPAHFTLTGGPQCDSAKHLSGTEGSARSGALRGERLLVLPSEPVTGGESDCGSAATASLERIFDEECELREREFLLAQQKAQFVRDLKKNLSLLLANQDEEVQSTDLSTSRGLAMQQANAHSLDDYVIHKPVDVIDGMNRISAYVGGCAAGGAPLQTLLNGTATTSRHPGGPRMRRAVSALKREPPLQSPLPPDRMPFPALQQWQQQQQQQQLRHCPTTPAGRCLDAVVQTGTATEDATGGWPLTIERDETFTKQVRTSLAAASSTSSLSAIRASGASSLTNVACHDLGDHNRPSSHSTSSGGNKKKAAGEKSLDACRKSTETQKSSCGTGGDKSSAGEKKKVHSPMHDGNRTAPSVEPSPPPKIVNVTLPTRVTVQLKSLSPIPNGSATAVGVVESNKHGEDTREMPVDPGFQYPLPVSRTAAWYLPNSRVLDHTEFKNLLCENWVPPPKSVENKQVPEAWLPTVGVEVAQPPPAAVRDLRLGTDNFILEFPPPPDLPVPDMPPPGKQKKTKCFCMSCKVCSAVWKFCRCFPSSKGAGHKKDEGLTAALFTLFVRLRRLCCCCCCCSVLVKSVYTSAAEPKSFPSFHGYIYIYIYTV
ncbi:hypothetical protein TRSC58_02317 [Trypanosoma rangeli SC58]|uniref:Uncharacterized protein n=1 Tax=Trypanosoma rangeli SC58 TaxID=429131 RepID=A0A061J750_TRYRA|nr:hypothetical protein TRSC58_02317 [Trypanosoma rangeli SC58]